VAAVLPAVFLLGEFTFAALLRNTLENLVLLRQMQRIRSYYRTLVPEADPFFGPAEEAARSSAAMATVGLRARPAGLLFTGASARRWSCSHRPRHHRPSPQRRSQLAIGVRLIG